MNANRPMDILMSFERFHQRGGLTDQHIDGWGIAFFEKRGVRLFLDDKPSVYSPVASMVREYPIKSEYIIAHVRKATQGCVSVDNCHPFMREMWGQYWVFAHNGNLIDFEPRCGDYFTPVGTTDSESAFCHIMESLRKRWNKAPESDVLCAAIAELAAEIRAWGIFNFMLSNGEWLFAHCSNNLHYVAREAAASQDRLVDQGISVEFTGTAADNDHAAIIATAPLTEHETWIAFLPQQSILFRSGRPIWSSTTESQL